MSRTGPEFVESESELFSDVDRKRENGDVSSETAEIFIELYEFAKEIGDEVSIGGAKNANFQLKIDAHQGSYPSDPAIFTANITGKLKIWPAKMIIKHEPGLETVSWDSEDYQKFENAFQSLSGTPRTASKMEFDAFASNVAVDEFQAVVEDFVSTCREKAQASS